MRVLPGVGGYHPCKAVPQSRTGGSASAMSTAASSTAERSSAAVVRIHGHVAEPLELTVQHLRRLPEQRVTVSFDCLKEGPQFHDFEGPTLWDVLRTIGPSPDYAARKQRSRLLLTVTGSDEHCAVLSWGEVDPEFGGQRILLATSIDGLPLDSAGPQLVVPADVCGARYISGIRAVWVGPAAG